MTARRNMASYPLARYELTGTLVVRDPLHVGGLGVAAGIDLPLAVNGSGAYCIPGQSLAGALRAWCAKVYDTASVNKIWGPPINPGGADLHTHASRVDVRELAPDEADLVPAEIRHGVGIDRWSGAAADRVKYTRQILPRGTKLPFHLAMEPITLESAALARDMLVRLKDALEHEDVRLGGGQSRGLGLVKLTDARLCGFGNIDTNVASPESSGLRGRAGMHALLTKQPDVSSEAFTLTEPMTKHRPIRVTIDWEPRATAMVKSGLEGIALNALPLLTHDFSQKKLFPSIPGASIKGLLRSHAERIIRTLLPQVQPDAGESDFAHQIEVPLVDTLFGCRGQQDTRKSWHGRGAVQFRECYAQGGITDALWRKLLLSEWESSQRDPLLLREDVDFRARFNLTRHNAVDRWTGSPANGFLFAIVEPRDVEWEPIVLDIDPKRLGTDNDTSERGPALALLLVTLRDFMQRGFAVGYRTNHGLGAAMLKRVTIESPDSGLIPNAEFRNGDLGAFGGLQRLWVEWLRGNRR